MVCFPETEWAEYSRCFFVYMLSGLNPQQQNVAQHKEGPLLVIAGAGSGKTRALTHRIAYLLSQGVPYWQILAVTFTNKAAGEMKDRVQNMIQDASLPLIGTFHSIGVRILRADFEHFGRDRDFTILDTDDSLSILKKILKSLGVDDKKSAVRTILGKISFAKNNFFSPEQYAHGAKNQGEQMIAEVFQKYEQKKKDMNAVDFDDLIVLPVVLFEKNLDILEKYRNRWKFISVDEFQDTNAVQLRFLDLLTSQHRNLCAIGDSDQSIYAFRGADISNILNFQNLYSDAKFIKLEQNYRSTQNILDAADGVIQNNESRVPKKMWTDNGEGEKVEIIDCEDEREEAEIIGQTIEDLQKIDHYKYSDFAILIRTNAQSRILEEMALRKAIPYQIIGGLKFYARKEIRDILAYLKYINNQKDTESLLRIINLPPRKIGAATIVRLQQYALQQGMHLSEVIDHVECAEGISPSARYALSAFSKNINDIRKQKEELYPSEIIKQVGEVFHLEKFYCDGSEEGEMRYENILELQSVARKFDGLEKDRLLSRFLEEVALISDTDSADSSEKITIMTLHSSKGLEFPIVFLPGMEEGLLPHSRSFFDPDSLEEERRLTYVGMTRAMKKLMLLKARSRVAFGDFQRNLESRFLEEIPSHCSYRPGKEGAEGDDDFQYTSIENEEVFTPPFEEGDRVRHKIFGVGSILDIQGSVAEIAFDTKGKKKIALSVAPLEKI
jgi:DNA helicase-2/ATP-dependent DNA helicase PcrA